MDESDDEDDDGGGSLAQRLAQTQADETSDAESVDSAPETDATGPPLRMPNTARGSFRVLSPRARKAKSPVNAAATPQTSPPVVASPEPSSPAPVVVEDETPTVPPLPRFLVQFRRAAWFQHHYPLATPRTFNFLRPASRSSASVAQIPFAAVVALLAGDGTSNDEGLLFQTEAPERM